MSPWRTLVETSATSIAQAGNNSTSCKNAMPHAWRWPAAVRCLSTPQNLLVENILAVSATDFHEKQIHTWLYLTSGFWIGSGKFMIQVDLHTESKGPTYTSWRAEIGKEPGAFTGFYSGLIQNKKLDIAVHWRTLTDDTCGMWGRRTCFGFVLWTNSHKPASDKAICIAVRVCCYWLSKCVDITKNASCFFNRCSCTMRLENALE